jgi:hypothetical protein
VKPSTTTPKPRKATPAELGAALFLFVASVVLAGTLVQHRLGQAPKKTTDDPLAGTVIVPTVAQEGVVVTPSPGRLLFVDSTPGGAELRLDGTRRGETPFSTDLNCEEGKPTLLELSKPGYQTARYELKCVNGSTRVSSTLKRAR